MDFDKAAYFSEFNAIRYEIQKDLQNSAFILRNSLHDKRHISVKVNKQLELFGISLELDDLECLFDSFDDIELGSINRERRLFQLGEIQQITYNVIHHMCLIDRVLNIVIKFIISILKSLKFIDNKWLKEEAALTLVLSLIGRVIRWPVILNLIQWLFRFLRTVYDLPAIGVSTAVIPIIPLPIHLNQLVFDVILYFQVQRYLQYLGYFYEVLHIDEESLELFLVEVHVGYCGYLFDQLVNLLG